MRRIRVRTPLNGFAVAAASVTQNESFRAVHCDMGGPKVADAFDGKHSTLLESDLAGGRFWQRIRNETVMALFAGGAVAAAVRNAR